MLNNDSLTLTSDVLSLRDYINNLTKLDGLNKPKTFCLLMKEVENEINSDSRPIMRLNLDDIKINYKNGKVILPDSLFWQDLDKTMIGSNPSTIVSSLSSTKKSYENRMVSFASMILGYYNKKTIVSDLDILENYNEYIKNVPTWLHDYFERIFKKLDYQFSFNDYYNERFKNVVKLKIKMKVDKLFPNEEEQNKQELIGKLQKIVGNIYQKEMM